jgi:hypothetical protein
MLIHVQRVASTMIRAPKDLSMYAVWLVEPLSNGIHTEVYMQTRGYANLRQLVSRQLGGMRIHEDRNQLTACKLMPCNSNTYAWGGGD